jgi:hypothetical protein
MSTLPPPTVRPCNECPWRRESAPGWLGPFDADEWIMLGHSDEPIACHETIGEDEDWSDPKIRQCAGAAQYRRNVAKRPHDPDVAVASSRDDVTVFGSPMQFKEHHS